MAKYPKRPKLKALPKKPKALKKPKSSASLEAWEKYESRVKAQMDGFLKKKKEVEKENSTRISEWEKKCKEIDQRQAKKESLQKKVQSLSGAYSKMK